MTFREFDVKRPEQREVGFKLAGVDFPCVSDISIGTMEDYRAQFVPNEEDPTKVGIPLEAAVQLIEGALFPSAQDAPDEHQAQVEKFRQVRRELPFDTGGDTIHAIREYLIGIFTKVDPTTEPTPLQDGSSASDSTSQGDSGSTA